MKAKKMISSLIAAMSVSALVIPSAISADEMEVPSALIQSDDTLTNLDLDQVSKSFGHLIKKNIESLGLDFDVALVVKGIQEAVEGKDAPLDENECIQAISLIQENAFQKQASINLQLTEERMAQNRQNDNIVEIENGKVQYEIQVAGTGEEVKADCVPTIRYTGKFIDGTVFTSSEDDEVVPLSETIPGLARAIVGMREGEQRTAYIHPEMAFGNSGYVPPSAMLEFNIELVKANTPADENVDQLVDQTLEELALQSGEGAIR